jgi:hypothetical protein
MPILITNEINSAELLKRLLRPSHSKFPGILLEIIFSPSYVKAAERCNPMR